MSGPGEESPRENKKIKKMSETSVGQPMQRWEYSRTYQRKCRGRGVNDRSRFRSGVGPPRPSAAAPRLHLSSTADLDLIHPQHLQSTRAAPIGEWRRGEADDELRRPESGTKENGGSREPERRTSRSRQKGDRETRARRECPFYPRRPPCCNPPQPTGSVPG
jgi:hypothetical protein